MRFVKKASKCTLVFAELLLALLMFIFVVQVILGVYVESIDYIYLFPDFDYIAFLPGFDVMFFFMAVGAFGDSVSLVILSLLVPFVLLIGLLLLGKRKWLSRFIIYPILVISCYISYMSNNGFSVFIIVSLIYIVLALLADLLPE